MKTRLQMTKAERIADTIKRRPPIARLLEKIHREMERQNPLRITFDISRTNVKSRDYQMTKVVRRAVAEIS